MTRHPLAYLKTLSYAFRHRNRSASFVSLIRGSMNGVEQRRQMSHSDRQNILLHFFLVMPFAAMILREGYTWVHAAFANIPSSFALLTLRLTGVAYSVSAHAMDIFIRPELLEEKFNHARFVVILGYRVRKFIRSIMARILTISTPSPLTSKWNLQFCCPSVAW